MEKIFAWFKANYPEYELIYQYNQIDGSHLFYIRKLVPGALMFKKIVSTFEIRNSTCPDELIMDTLKGLIESTEE